MAAKKRMVLIISRVMALTTGGEVCGTEWVNISGTVYYEGTPLCVMVLANGEHKFTNAADGWYQMDVPLNSNGEITLFSFCDGFAPFKAVLEPWEASNFEINMSPVSEDSVSMTLTTETWTPASSGYVKISGTALYDGKPLCVMVLANGQHTFTPAENGRYELEVPLNSNGKGQV